MYNRSEKMIGDVIGAGSPRDAMFLATKVWTTGKASAAASPRRTRRAISKETAAKIEKLAEGVLKSVQGGQHLVGPGAQTVISPVSGGFPTPWLVEGISADSLAQE